MSLSLFTKFKRTLAEDESLTKRLYDKEQSDTDSRTHTASETGVTAVVNGTPKVLQFTQITTVRYFDVETDREVTITLGTQSFRVKPVTESSSGKGDGIKGKLALMTLEAVTSMTVTNVETGTTATVTYCLAGV